MNKLNYQKAIGGGQSILAYIIWGLSPLFWKLLTGVSPWIIVANRMIWSCIMMLFLVIGYKQLSEIKNIFKDKKGLGLLFICSFLIFCNWAIYIWAVSNQRIIEASLGYYINPLMVILLSKIFLHEQFDSLKKISIIIAMTGICIMIFRFGHIPYISLSLSSSFAIYGLIKKKIKYSPIQTMFIENFIAFLPAFLFVIFSPITYTLPPTIHIILALGGVITGVPLILFASGVKKINLSTQGYIQFIAPTILFFLSKYVFREEISQAQFTALIFIWVACFIFIISLFVQKPFSLQEEL